MTAPRRTGRLDDDHVELLVGQLLQIGVIVAALVVLLGGTLLLAHHGHASMDFHTFHSEPGPLRSVHGAIRAAFGGDPRAIVQFGLVLLIATPVARVALLLGAFALQKDRLYVLLATVVLVLLLVGLVFGLG
jgi:uncharacterized membrane protein